MCCVPKIGDFSGKVDIYSKREVLNINRFPLVVFFRKKFFRAESCAEDILVCGSSSEFPTYHFDL